MRKIVIFVVLALILTGFAGCGKQVEEVTLEFAPEVGKTYNYMYSINLAKTTYGRTADRNFNGSISMEILGKEGDAYHTKWVLKTPGAKTGAENTEKDTIEPIFIDISDRYVFNREGTNNLHFPEGLVKNGAEWEGKCLFESADMATLELPEIDMTYKLVKVKQRKDGVHCTIKCRSGKKRIKVPYQMSLLGIKYDTEKKVTAVLEGSGANGKIRVGDELIGINGETVSTPARWYGLVQTYIEGIDDIGDSVQLNILRDGTEKNVDVTKSLVTPGTIQFEIKKIVRTVVFNAAKGIVISDVADVKYSMTNDFSDSLPFVDDYSGRESFAALVKSGSRKRKYKSRWRLKLSR